LTGDIDLERIERQIALLRETPGRVTAQDMIDLFRAEYIEGEPVVEYPDGEPGPARLSICAEAIRNRWGRFVNNLLDRMEQERRRAPTSESGRMGLALTQLASTPFYDIRFDINPLPNTVIVAPPPAAPAPGRPTPAPQLFGLTQAAGNGLAQAAQIVANRLEGVVDNVINNVVTEGGLNYNDAAQLLLGDEPAPTPQAQAVQEQIRDSIDNAAAQVAGPLVAAIVQQTAQMQSMMSQFPAAPPTPPPQQPALVQPITPDQANDLVVPSIEAQQERTAALQGQTSAAASPLPLPSRSTLTSGPASPAFSGSATPRQRAAGRQPSAVDLQIALQRAVVEGTNRPQQQQQQQGQQQQGQGAARRRQPASSAPTTPQTGAPVTRGGYATAPASPLGGRVAGTLPGGRAAPLTPVAVLTQTVVETGSPANTQAQGVPTPPVIPADERALLANVTSEVRTILWRRVAERQGQSAQQSPAVQNAAATLAGMRERFQQTNDPQIQRVTRVALGEVMQENDIDPELQDQVLAYVQGQTPNNPLGLAQTLQQEVRARQPQGTAAEQAQQGVRRTRAGAARIASGVIDENFQTIVGSVEPDTQVALFEILDRARLQNITSIDDWVALMEESAGPLTQTIVASVSQAIKNLPPAAAVGGAPQGQGITPGTE
jgi:hypothetical protein